MEKINLKRIIAYALGFLTLMAAVKLIGVEIYYGVPIFNYVSFSNIIGFILDTLYGTAGFISAIIIIFLFREILSGWCKKFKKSFVPIVVALLCAGLFFWIYFCTNGGFDNVGKLRIILFIGLLFSGVAAIYLKWIKPEDINVLIGFLICIFIYVGGKVMNNNDYGNRKKHRSSDEIIFKDSTKLQCDSNTYIVANTTDFIFVFREKIESYSVYPMSEIKEITQLRPENPFRILVYK